MKDIELKEQFEETLEVMVQYHSNDLKALDHTFDVWSSVSKKKIRIYSLISKRLFEIDLLGANEIDELVGIFSNNLQLIIEIAQEKDLYTTEFKEFIDKIQDHVELVNVQISKIDDGIKNAERVKEDLKREIQIKELEIKKLKDDFEMIKDKQNKALKRAKSVQKDFVTILGIFASILITTFGGLTILTSIFNNIQTAPTGKLILFGSLVVLAIIMTVFLLLNGISKLSELNLKSCGCVNDVSCNCSIVKKHPTLYIVTVSLLVSALIGASEYVIDYKRLFSSYGDKFLFETLSNVVLIIIIAAVGYFIYWRKKINVFKVT